MNKFLQLAITAQNFFKHNAMLLMVFVYQTIAQCRVAAHFLQFDGLLAGLTISFVLALAHVIPAYLVYVVGVGTGSFKNPSLKSKIAFCTLGGILAFILSLTFTCCALGILCQPTLSLVVKPTIQAAGYAALICAAWGAILDVLAAFVIHAQGPMATNKF